jgi:uncharacterized protein YecE (DUF72 family)
MDFHIGCSGWGYRHWVGDFYPAGLPAAEWLEHYAVHFSTVELNSSFYRLPSESVVAGWRRRTPEGFRFAVKASRLITHFRRLRDCEAELNRFLGRMRGLGERLGPVLFQTPPSLERDPALLRDFLRLLPSDIVSAFELRDGSWWEQSTFDLLTEAGAAFCIHNLGREWTPIVATCDDIYVRLHGPEGTCASAYGDDALRGLLRALPGASRAWVYFNNDVGGHAPRDAARLIELVRESLT